MFWQYFGMLTQSRGHGTPVPRSFVAQVSIGVLQGLAVTTWTCRLLPMALFDFGTRQPVGFDRVMVIVVDAV